MQPHSEKVPLTSSLHITTLMLLAALTVKLVLLRHWSRIALRLLVPLYPCDYFYLIFFFYDQMSVALLGFWSPLADVLVQ